MNGHAHGGVTVLNATATGRGCSLAVRGGVDAQWAWQDEGVIVQGAPDSRLAIACHAVAQEILGREDGASIQTQSQMPPSRGLKTSSSAAAAMLRAAGVPESNLELACVEASLRAGVTLTGAFDDQVAVLRGGCHLTDNARKRVLAQIFTQPWHVAIWVPERAIDKAQLMDLDATAIEPEILAAEDRLLADDVPAALTLNGAAFHRLYQAAGLPVDDAPTRVALEHGALGAGLSGTGPAVAALFDRPVDLPDVPGGTWKWTQVQEAA
ncbi:MAG: shikimate kinase [Thermoplasmatota archaeon]